MEAGGPRDRQNQGCVPKEAAWKAACGQISEGPGPCGDRSEVSAAGDGSCRRTAAEESRPRGQEEPKLESPVSRAGWGRTAAPGAHGCSLPALPCTARAAAPAEVPLKGPIDRGLLKQRGLYPQAPTPKMGPTPSGLQLCAPDALLIRYPPGPSPEGTGLTGPLVLDTLRPLPPSSPSGPACPKLKESSPLSPQIEAHSPLESGLLCGSVTR